MTTLRKVDTLAVSDSPAGGDVVIKQQNDDTSRRISVATEAEVLSPSTNPKLLTNVALNYKIKDLEKQLGVNWGSWSSVGSPTSINNSFTDGTQTIGEIVISLKSTGFNAKTGTIPAGSDAVLLRNTSASAAVPALTKEGAVLRGGLVFVDGAGRRWFKVLAWPEADDAEESFYLDGSSAWVAESYDGTETEPSFTGLPDDGKLYPVNSSAHDMPAGNVFETGLVVGMRDGNKNRALRIAYDSNDSQFDVFVSSRTFTASGGGTPSITEEAIYSNSSGLLRNSTASLITGKSFADYDEIYFEASPNSTLLHVQSGNYSTANFDTSGMCLCFDQSHNYQLEVNWTGTQYSLNVFTFKSDTNTVRLHKIIGRKFS